MASESSKCIRFIECLKNPMGTDWAFTPVKLLEWQKQDITSLLDNDPPIREYSLWMGRGNGKTSYISFLSTYFLTTRQNQSIVLLANTKEEAGTLYSFVSSTIRQDPYLLSICRIYGGEAGNVKRIHCYKTNSELKVISNTFDGKLGGNTSIFIAEEAGAFKHREVYEAITTSMSKRLSPTLIINLSHAGSDTTSFGYELWENAKNNKDPQHLVKIYQGDPKKWDDIDEWYKVNPSLKELANKEYIVRKINKAKETPTLIPSIQKYNLNNWIEQSDTPAIPLDLWDACDEKIDIESLKNKPCYWGCDIGSVDDFSSVLFEFVIDGKYILLPYYFTPAATLAQRAQKEKKPYKLWVDQGHLIAVPGNTLNGDVILDFLNEKRKEFRLLDGAVDRYFNANDLVIDIAKAGMRVEKIGAGVQTIAPALHDLCTQVKQKKVIHNNHPILRWNVSNSRAYFADHQANVMISKKNSKGKTDGLMAGLYAHARLMFHKNKGAGTVSFVRF